MNNWIFFGPSHLLYPIRKRVAHKRERIRVCIFESKLWLIMHKKPKSYLFLFISDLTCKCTLFWKKKSPVGTCFFSFAYQDLGDHVHKDILNRIFHVLHKEQLLFHHPIQQIQWCSPLLSSVSSRSTNSFLHCTITTASILIPRIIHTCSHPPWCHTALITNFIHPVGKLHVLSVRVLSRCQVGTG